MGKDEASAKGKGSETKTDEDYNNRSDGTKGKKGCNCNPSRPAPNNILQRELHFDVNAKGRKCTDCYCCIVYLLFCTVWVGVAAVAIYFGNIYVLIYGTDYEGNVCGTINPKTYSWWENPDQEWGLDHPQDYREKKFMYYPRLNDDLIDYALSIGSQVQDLDIMDMEIETLLNISLMGVCVPSCPVYSEVVCTNQMELSYHQAFKDKNAETVNGTTEYKLCDPKIDGQCKPTAAAVGKCRGGELLFGLIKNPYYYLNQELCSNCWVTPLNTTEIFYRCLEIIWKQDTDTEKCIWPESNKEVNGETVALKPGEPGYIYAKDDACITKEVLNIELSQQPAYDNPVAEMLGDALSTLQGWISDLYNAMYVILIIGCAGSVGMGFLWIFLLRWLTKPIVWGTIVVFLLTLFLGALWGWLNTGWFPSDVLATWLGAQLTTLGVSHPILDYIITSLNTTEPGNLTLAADNPVTQAVGQSLPYDLNSVGAIDVQTLWRVEAITVTVLWVAGIVTVIILAKKIMIAIAIIEEAAIAVMRMPHMVFLPFVTAAFIVVVFLWFVLLGAVITSLEDLKVEDVLKSVGGWVSDNLGECNATNITSKLSFSNDNIPVTIKVPDRGVEAACSGLQYLTKWGDKSLNDFLIIFHLFCFLWTNELLQAITISIVAGAVCDWYWTRPSGPKYDKVFNPAGPDPKRAFKGGDGKTFQFPLVSSTMRTFRFHLGSLAFGSFLVACVQMMRIIFEYIKTQTRSWAQKNKCFKIMFKIITVVLMCFEKCVKFITKNAYIMIAMQGHGFCDSCCHAFKLLLTNLVQFVLVGCFSKVVVTLGKIAIMATGVIASYFWLANDPIFTEWTPSSGDEVWDNYQGLHSVNNKFLPVIIVGFLAYICASAFLHVYDLAIASILLCFCEDFKVHQVGDVHFPELHREVYMPNSLRRIVLSPKEFAHMQQPMTHEQIMAAAGVDTFGKEEHDLLTKEEILDTCKKILVSSDEFIHLHINESALTEKQIVNMTGGSRLRAELQKPNPMYDKEFAVAVQRGDEHVKKGFKDPRLNKYKPQINRKQLLDIIKEEGHLNTHVPPMTEEQMKSHTTETHGEEMANQIERKKTMNNAHKFRTKTPKGGNKIVPDSVTPVSDARSVNAENDNDPNQITAEGMI